MKEVNFISKRVFLYAFTLLVLSALVFAAHTTTVSISPNSSYETVPTNFLLTITNINTSTDSINTLNLSLNGYSFNSIWGLPSGWGYSTIGSIITFNTTNNPIAPQSIFNPGWASFGITAVANLVNFNSSYIWNATTEGTMGSIYNNNITVTALNDSTPPIISLISPADYSFVKNNSLINFIINATDPETGISPNYFYIGFRDDASNIQTSGAITGTIQLNQINQNQYSGQLDSNNPSYMKLNSGNKFLDYRFTNLSDSAGNVYVEDPNLPHHIFVDTQAPTLIINNPASQFTTNKYFQNITFNVSDDSFIAIGQGSFAPAVNCSVQVDNNINNSRYYTNAVNNTGLEINLTGLQDGLHTWNISCTDKAGYVSSASNTIILDTTGPNITVTSPTPTGIVISNTTQINLFINDTYSGVSFVNASNQIGPLIISNTSANNFNLSALNLSAGLNTITVTADDTLGNINTINFNYTVDVNPPAIYLVNVSNSNGQNINFTFNVSDDYSPTSNCLLNITDNSNNQVYSNTTTTSNNQLTTIITTLTNGTYNWAVTCTDQANNINTTSGNTFNVDTIPPYIVLTSPISGSNSNINTISFNYTTYDASGIQNCSLYINNQLNSTNSTITNDNLTNNSISINLTASNNPYNWLIGCTDIYGNKANSTQQRVYYDTIPPIISNLTNSTTDTTAKISWNTDEASNDTIYYWVLNGIPLTITNSTASTSKSYVLSGLSQSTTYYYNITSSDQFGNLANTTALNFTTLATPTPSSGPSGGGGGGGGGGFSVSTVCTPNWTASSWSSCSINGLQTRKVTDNNSCGTDQNKPVTVQSCAYVECTTNSNCVSGYNCVNNKCEKIQQPIANQTQQKVPPVTGFAILNLLKGNAKTAVILGLGILLLIIGAYMWLREDKVDEGKIKQIIEEGGIRKN